MEYEVVEYGQMIDALSCTANQPQNLTQALDLLRNFSDEYPELADIASSLENATDISDITQSMDLVANFTETYAPEAAEQVEMMQDLVDIINMTSSINITAPGGLENLSKIINENLTSIIDKIVPPPVTTLAVRETEDPDDLAIPPGESRIITYLIEVINGLKPLEIIILAERLHPDVQFINASGDYTMKPTPNDTELL